jgi:hypothetical protein
VDYGFDPSGEQQGPFRMTGYTPFGKVPRRAKGAPSVGMTDLKAYDTTNDFNKTSIFTLNLEAPFNHFPFMGRLYITLHY